ncbi:hypothetical protein B0919_23890 [Hymenobacter sp. CRA2]|nr:hypothetical protein B0919_23890 [Hymenobacter sp. CRA2]
MRRTTTTSTTTRALPTNSGGALKTDGAGNVYVTNSYQGTIELGGSTLTSTEPNAYVAKYNDAGTLLWARNVQEAAQPAGVTALALDATGNVYLTGSFAATMALGTSTLTEPLGSSFLAKLDTQGNPVWLQAIGRSGASSGYNTSSPAGLGVDGNGNILVAGTYTGTVDMGGTTLTSVLGATADGSSRNTQDFFIAKYNAQAGLVWARSEGGTGEDWAGALAADAAGNAYVAGGIEGPVTIGGTTLSGTPNNLDGFAAKYSAGGSPTWVSLMPTSIRSLGLDNARSLAIDNAGNVAVGGFVEDGSVVGNYLKAYLVHFTAQGTSDWHHLATGTMSYPGSVAIDEFGNSYFSSRFLRAVGMGLVTVSAVPTNNTLNPALAVFSFTPQGTVRWTQQSNDVGAVYPAPQGLALNSAGQLYVAGTLAGLIGFGNLAMPTSRGNQETFFARLSSVTTGTRSGRQLAPLAVYPSPARQLATVRLPAGREAGHLTVRDALGRMVQTVPYAATATELPLSVAGLAQGVYHVQAVAANGATAAGRLLVE